MAIVLSWIGVSSIVLAFGHVAENETLTGVGAAMLLAASAIVPG